MSTRERWWLVVLLWFCLALNYVDRQMAYSIFPALKADLGFTDARLGLIGSIFAWIYSLCMPFAGRLADRFRRDRMIVMSLLLWSAATLGCSFSGSVTQFLSWRAVMGVTEALYYPAAVGMIAAAHAGSSRSKALGIHQAAQFAGLVVGGWYGGWMADHFGWRNGFSVAALVGIGYAVMLFFRLRREETPAVEAKEESGASAGARALLSPGYLALSTAFFFFCAMLWVFYAWFPSFLVERFGLSMTASGFNATVFLQVSCGAGVLAGGALADRLIPRIPAARFYVAAAGVLLSAPFGYLTFAADTLEMTRIYSAAYGACSGLMIANVFAAAMDVVGSRSYSFGAGVLNMVGGISSAFMIYMAGIWKNTMGFPELMKGTAIICCAAGVLLAITGWATLRRTVVRQAELVTEQQ